MTLSQYQTITKETEEWPCYFCAENDSRFFVSTAKDPIDLFSICHKCQWVELQ